MLKKLVPAGVLGLVLAISACGSEKTETGAPPSAAPSVPTNAALAAMVPDAIKADGKILVGTDATYAPSEYIAEDGKTVVGFDVDLFRAVAGTLGLTAEFQPATFGDIIPGVGSGKYEIGVSSFTINPERKQQALMVSYYSAGTQWATKKGNPAKVSVDDPCGKRIAVQKDTVQADDIAKRSAACKAAGKPEVIIEPYPGQDQVANSVVSGKDDAMLADSPVSAYAVKQTNGQLELLGEIYDAAPYGYVIAKDQQKFAEAVRGAVEALIANGAYLQVLKAWGVESGAIGESQINP